MVIFLKLRYGVIAGWQTLMQRDSSIIVIKSMSSGVRGLNLNPIKFIHCITLDKSFSLSLCHTLLRRILKHIPMLVVRTKLENKISLHSSVPDLFPIQQMLATASSLLTKFLMEEDGYREKLQAQA